MEGGSDTSSSLILAIVQALILNPEVQQRAHREIDTVIGEDRSPEWSDMDKLPYINMIVKEGHRWRPILPLCFPHALGQGKYDLQFRSPKYRFRASFNLRTWTPADRNS